MSRKFRFTEKGAKNAEFSYCKVGVVYEVEGWPNSQYSLYYRNTERQTGAIGSSVEGFRRMLQDGHVEFVD